MPIPKPSKGEIEGEFVARCMSNSIMKKEYPDKKQRLAVCFSSWKKKSNK